MNLKNLSSRIKTAVAQYMAALEYNEIEDLRHRVARLEEDRTREKRENDCKV